MLTRFPRLPAAAVLREARVHLRRGGVVAYPTESCFGLGCDPCHARGLRRVIALKGRPNHKGMIVIADQLAAVQPLLRPLSPVLRAECARYWPGANTLLLPAHKRVLPWLRGRHARLAVRVTAHQTAAALCGRLGALVSTSANRAGQRALRSARACRRVFPDVLVLSGRVGSERRPSRIIDPMTQRIFR